jgi:UDP-3-O-acyl-N-acetylglucosamine deacetylase
MIQHEIRNKNQGIFFSRKQTSNCTNKPINKKFETMCQLLLCSVIKNSNIVGHLSSSILSTDHLNDLEFTLKQYSIHSTKQRVKA